MDVRTKIMLVDEEGDKFFGEGPCTLLKLVEETGSLRQAAMVMGMAYTKALKLLNHAEKALGVRLTERKSGGVRGGGSALTVEGRSIIERYERYRDACIRANRELYSQFFEGRE